MLTIGSIGIIAAPSHAGEVHFHAHLIKSEPAQHDTLHTSLTQVRLWFSEPVEPSLTRILLTDDAGSRIALGSAAPAGASAAALASSYAGAPLKSGGYHIAWSTVAKDGHPSKGQISFVVRNAAP